MKSPSWADISDRNFESDFPGSVSSPQISSHSPTSHVPASNTLQPTATQSATFSSSLATPLATNECSTATNLEAKANCEEKPLKAEPVRRRPFHSNLFKKAMIDTLQQGNSKPFVSVNDKTRPLSPSIHPSEQPVSKASVLEASTSKRLNVKSQSITEDPPITNTTTTSSNSLNPLKAFVDAKTFQPSVASFSPSTSELTQHLRLESDTNTQLHPSVTLAPPNHSAPFLSRAIHLRDTVMTFQGKSPESIQTFIQLSLHTPCNITSTDLIWIRISHNDSTCVTPVLAIRYSTPDLANRVRSLCCSLHAENLFPPSM